MKGDILRGYNGYSQLFHRDKKYITAFGMLQGEKILLAAGFDVPVLYVANDYLSAQNALRQLLGLGKKALYLPYPEEPLLHRKSVNNSFIFSLSKALFEMHSGFDVLVVCPEALCNFLPKKEDFKVFTYRMGQSVELQSVIDNLIACGYDRTEVLSVKGQFTVRGDILDVFTPTEDFPFRISFDYDEIESIRQINADLTSGEKFEQASFYSLVFKTRGDLLERAQKEAAQQKLSSSARDRINSILSDIEFSPFSRWLYCLGEKSFLSQYLSQNTLLLWEEPKVISQRLDKLYEDFVKRCEALAENGEVLFEHKSALLPRAEMISGYLPFEQIALQQLNYVGTFFTPQEIISFHSTPLYNYQYSPRQLEKDYTEWAKQGYRTVVFSGDEEGVKRSRRQLELLGIPCVEGIEKTAQGAKEAVIAPLLLEKGFVSHTGKLVAIGVKDLGGKVKEVKKPVKNLSALFAVSAGDYVVHDVHGIGRCEGITTLQRGQGNSDYILVTYKNNDKLYVPVANASSLSRFSGSEKAPELSKIGGKDFEKVKAKVKASIKEMSFDLLKLYALRQNKRGYSYRIDDYLCKAFDESFPYAETPDQLKSIAEIDADLTGRDIMDRLLIGDVGFGKTEVALRAAFKVIANGYQAAFLAPTTILSEQHFLTAKDRMESFGIKIACLNRFRSAAEQKKIISQLKEHKIDFIIGTHRLLSKDVGFDKLGLLILDEEQRFGVEHKESLKNIKTNVDVLTLSATPIPRTLYMALSGIRDISLINTPPLKRIAVETFVVEENLQLIKEIISRELMREGQVFLVYNRVESIENFTKKIRELVPQAKIVMAHGQMDSKVLEDAVFSFAQNKANVLISTTIIENGIDMPNANTLIVFDADRLGLSQMYQLRGRVGRSDRLAYAYFVYGQNKVLSQTAYQRLTSIMEYSELGSGFRIAMRDLEIRGAGNILGAEQHGNLQKVGYDMFTRLLKEAVAELKGGKGADRENFFVTVESDAEVTIPQYYVADSYQRMSIYQRASAISSLEEGDKILEELTDIYGHPPKSVLNLIDTVKIKYLASLWGISEVTILGGKAELSFKYKNDFFRKETFDLIEQNKETLTISSTSLKLTYTNAGEKESLLVNLLALLLSVDLSESKSEA